MAGRARLVPFNLSASSRVPHGSLEISDDFTFASQIQLHQRDNEAEFRETDFEDRNPSRIGKFTKPAVVIHQSIFF
jgi:hypothetical protein